MYAGGVTPRKESSTVVLDEKKNLPNGIVGRDQEGSGEARGRCCLFGQQRQMGAKRRESAVRSSYMVRTQPLPTRPFGEPTGHLCS